MSNNCFRLMTQNFVDTEILANSDVSSEQAAFPVSNAFNKQRRSKVWRSNGYWEILSGSNTIDFKETSGGATLTATIPENTYTTAELLTELETQFEAEGASNYVWSQDSTTLKINALSDGVGAGGDFELLWTSSTAMADILGFDTGVDDTGALTYDADSLKIHTEEFILFDLGISSDPTAFILTDDRNASIQISPDAVIRLQGNETDNWTTPSFTKDLTYDDENIALLNEDGLAGEQFRYWRFQIIDDNPNGYVQVGAFFLGNHLWFDISAIRASAQFPLGFNKIDRSRVVFSEGGQQFTDELPKAERFDITFNAVTIEEKEDFEESWEQLGRTIPFFISMDSNEDSNSDPDPVFSTKVNRTIKYVKYDSAPTISLIAPRIYIMKLSFQEQL